jgi:hypothetical protein
MLLGDLMGRGSSSYGVYPGAIHPIFTISKIKLFLLANIASFFKGFTDRDTLLHLRVPFSYYLLPVFLVGISQASNIHAISLVVVFIAQHLFIYPASNIYNSYMDKDTGSIGGLEYPPPVTVQMYHVSIVLDGAGLLLCLIAGWQHALLMAGYIAFSKSYSWYGIRLKKYALWGWLSVMFFQGGYTFMQGHMATENFVSIAWFNAKNLECMLFASLIIGGSYPLTQVYQHGEDGERGDHTISYKLGVRGTFIFTSVFFAIGTLLAFHYFTTYYSIIHFLIFLGGLSPVAAYFSWWFLRVVKDPSQANYRYAMLMNKVSATCMIICFSIIAFINHTVA